MDKARGTSLPVPLAVISTVESFLQRAAITGSCTGRLFGDRAILLGCRRA
jgi:hypothetical protein